LKIIVRTGQIIQVSQSATIEITSKVIETPQSKVPGKLAHHGLLVCLVGSIF
jgi:hypothetical protein